MAKNLTAFLAQNAKKIDNVTFIASGPFHRTPIPARLCRGKSTTLPRRRMLV